MRRTALLASALIVLAVAGCRVALRPVPPPPPAPQVDVTWWYYPDYDVYYSPSVGLYWYFGSGGWAEVNALPPYVVFSPYGVHHRLAFRGRNPTSYWRSHPRVHRRERPREWRAPRAGFRRPEPRRPPAIRRTQPRRPPAIRRTQPRRPPAIRRTRPSPGPGIRSGRAAPRRDRDGRRGGGRRHGR